MKKLSNQWLIITLTVLVVVFVLSRFFFAPGREGNLRKSLVAVDTTLISEVKIRPAIHPESEITLRREGTSWKVTNGKVQSETEDGLVRSMVGMLTRIPPQRMVTRKKEKWNEFKVDDKGTHISVYTKGSRIADFVVGKTGYTPSSGGGYAGGFTYLRLMDESEVYAAEGFLESAFNRDYNDWRNKEVLRLRKEDLSKIIFHYPLDSGFVLEKRDSAWYVDRLGVRGGLIENYLNMLSLLKLSAFVEGFTPATKPDVTIQLEGKSGSLAQLEGWKTNSKWVLHSSWKKEIYFSLPELGTLKELLTTRKRLLEIK